MIFSCLQNIRFPQTRHTLLMAHKAPVQATCCETGAHYQEQNKESK